MKVLDGREKVAPRGENGAMATQDSEFQVFTESFSYSIGYLLVVEDTFCRIGFIGEN